MVDLRRIKTRVKILANSIGDFIDRHHCHPKTCGSLDVHVPVTFPKEYEFSCSSSPATPALHVTRSKRYYPCSFYYDYSNHHNHNLGQYKQKRLRVGPVVGPMESPLGRRVVLADPMKLQPLMMMNSCNLEGDGGGFDVSSCVDRAAEEFIERFHKELRLQKLDFPF